MREFFEVFWDMCVVVLVWLDYLVYWYLWVLMGILENLWVFYLIGIGMLEGIFMILVWVVEVSVKIVYYYISIYYWWFYNKDFLIGISY